MTKESSSVMSEISSTFTPTATVQDSDRLWGRSVELNNVLGKEVTINPKTERNFKVEGQPMKSFEVTTCDRASSYRVATNFLTTMCEQTSKMFGIKFVPIDPPLQHFSI
ncbi:MAG: hypothetical protein PF572_00930 [Patescibacteria group bacterium]|jgi:hypothetical protein|nr:hypothetical protein [Patescibacteria group bacterium]